MTQAAAVAHETTATVMEPQPIAVYNEFRTQLAELKKNNSLMVFDYETPRGNKDARSYIAKLRRTKAAVDDARKREKQASLDYGRRVDAEAKSIIEDIQEMIDVHQQAVDAIEQREKDRVDNIQSRITYIRNLGLGIIGDSQQPLGLCQFELQEKVIIDDSFAEFKGEAITAKEQAQANLQRAIEDLQKRTAEQAELDRLRKEEEDRKQAQREEQIRKEAVAAEQARQKQEAEDKAAAEERRAADINHKAQINAQAITALVKLGLAEDVAADVVEAIAGGSIPHIKIQY